MDNKVPHHAVGQTKERNNTYSQMQEHANLMGPYEGASD